MFTRARDVTKFEDLNKYRYSSIDNLLRSDFISGLHTLHLNNRYFDFVYRNKRSKVLFVTFGAAAGTDKPTYPIFSGTQMASLAEVDWLALSDAGQSSPENLKTTWHLGTQKIPTNQIIVNLIRRLAKKYKYETIVLFGSSAGGFAALNISRRIPGSIAVVMNPRTDLRVEPTTYDEFISKAFSNKHESVVEYASMCQAYSVPTGNRVIYLQNTEDEYYYQKHCLPFIQDNINTIKLISGRWGNGHVVPPKWVYENILKIVFEGPKTIDQFMDSNIEISQVSRQYDISVLADHVIGTPFNARSGDKQVADKLVEGLFTLPGRPEYKIDSDFDWRSDPYQDNNWKFNLNSLRWIDPLRRMFIATRRQEYIDKYREILYSWYKFHVLRDIHTPYSWYDMAAGSRVKVIAAAMELMPNDPWLSHLLYLHGEHLSNDKFLARKGNHTLHAMIGLLVCGHFFEKDDWLERSVRKITSLFNECVD